MLLDVRGACSTTSDCPVVRTIDAYAIVLDDDGEDGEDGARFELRLLNMIGLAELSTGPGIQPELRRRWSSHQISKGSTAVFLSFVFFFLPIHHGSDPQLDWGRYR